MPKSKRTSSSSVKSSPKGNATGLVVGSSVVLKGEISNAKEVSIDGVADVQLTAEKILIGKTGKVTGNITAQSAEVMGSLSGDVTVSNTLTIHSEGSISGKVAYKMLDIKLGGQIKGDIQAISGSSVSAPQQNKAMLSSKSVSAPQQNKATVSSKS